MKNILKFFNNNWINIILIVVFVAIIFHMLHRSSCLLEGMDNTTDTIDTTHDTNEKRAVSHIFSNNTGAPTSTTNAIVSALQSYDPKFLANLINTSAENLTQVLQNIDKEKIEQLRQTLISKLNDPITPSSGNTIHSNSTIANSLFNNVNTYLDNLANKSGNITSTPTTVSVTKITPISA